MDFPSLTQESRDRQRGKERGRFMNGQQGSDLVPGTGRDMLTAERGGVVRVFLGGKKLWNAGRGGGLRMDG